MNFTSGADHMGDIVFGRQSAPKPKKFLAIWERCKDSKNSVISLARDLSSSIMVRTSIAARKFCTLSSLSFFILTTFPANGVAQEALGEGASLSNPIGASHSNYDLLVEASATLRRRLDRLQTECASSAAELQDTAPLIVDLDPDVELADYDLLIEMSAVLRQRLDFLRTNCVRSVRGAQTDTSVSVESQSPTIPPVEEQALLGGELIQSLQTELSRLGCDPRGVDGIWGRNSQQALDRFASHSQYAGTALDVSMSTLLLLRTEASRVCPLDCGPAEQEIGGTCVRRTCPSGQRLNPSGLCFTPQAAAPPAPRDRASDGRVCYTMWGVTRCN